MADLLARMERLRFDRIRFSQDLDKNTIAMRLIVAEAKAAGVGVYEIATALGVSNRTAYLWLKK